MTQRLQEELNGFYPWSLLSLSDQVERTGAVRRLSDSLTTSGKLQDYYLIKSAFLYCEYKPLFAHVIEYAWQQTYHAPKDRPCCDEFLQDTFGFKYIHFGDPSQWDKASFGKMTVTSARTDMYKPFQERAGSLGIFNPEQRFTIMTNIQEDMKKYPLLVPDGPLPRTIERDLAFFQEGQQAMTRTSSRYVLNDEFTRPVDNTSQDHLDVFDERPPDSERMFQTHNLSNRHTTFKTSNPNHLQETPVIPLFSENQASMPCKCCCVSLACLALIIALKRNSRIQTPASYASILLVVCLFSWHSYYRSALILSGLFSCSLLPPLPCLVGYYWALLLFFSAHLVPLAQNQC